MKVLQRMESNIRTHLLLASRKSRDGYDTVFVGAILAMFRHSTATVSTYIPPTMPTCLYTPVP